MSDLGLLDPLLVDSLLQQHLASPGILDDEVIENMHTLGIAISFLPMQCVFMAKVYERAHLEAVDRRRQLRRQELQEGRRFMGRLSVTLFGVEGLQLPPPQDGWQHASIICQLWMDSQLRPTTRCSAPTLYWDQEFEFEVSRPCSKFVCKVVRVLVPLHPVQPATAASGPVRNMSSSVPDTPTSSGTAGQRSGVLGTPTEARRGESGSFIDRTREMTVTLAAAQVPLSTLESCKARKLWVSLQSICEQTVGSGGKDEKEATADPDAPPANEASIAGAEADASNAKMGFAADAVGARGGLAHATASGDAERQAMAGGGAVSGARVQMKMQYQYSDNYMAHSVPDVTVDFRICILGAGGAVGRKMLECFLKAEIWPASRIVACTRSLDKVQAAAAAGVVCTNKVSAAMQGCRVLVLCCRADQLVNQVAREVRANLPPDALVLSVIVGLTRQRQAQLLGIQETQLCRIAAPDSADVEATYYERVRAASHLQDSAGAAGQGLIGSVGGDDDGSARGRRDHDDAAPAGSNSMTRVGGIDGAGPGGGGGQVPQEVKEEGADGNRAGADAGQSKGGRRNGESEASPPAPDGVVTAAEAHEPVSSSSDHGTVVARNGAKTEGAQLGGGERRPDDASGISASKEDGVSSGDPGAQFDVPGDDESAAEGRAGAPDDAPGSNMKMGEEIGDQDRGVKTLEEGRRGGQPVVGQRKVGRALTYQEIIEEEERIKLEKEKEEARTKVMREAVLQTTLLMAASKMVSDTRAMIELVEIVSTALRGIGRPRSRGGATGETPKPDAKGLDRAHALAAAINALTATVSFPLAFSSEGFLDEQAMREHLPHRIDAPSEHVLQNEALLQLLRAHFSEVVRPLCGEVVSAIMAKFKFASNSGF